MKKVVYVLFIGTLTSTAVGACYWQSNRYLQSRKRWDVIKTQLNKTNPDALQTLQEKDIHPFKYVTVTGKLNQGFQKVDRMKKGRMGYLVVRKMTFGQDQQQQIVALEGWCEKDYDFISKKTQSKQWKGILREKQKKDYVHTHFAKQDLQNFKMTTYIDLETLANKFKLKPTHLSKNYYLQLLRPLQSTDHQSFPYQYSVDNFQLPYLTPDKHLSYATFWAFTSIVGLTAILRALRIK